MDVRRLKVIVLGPPGAGKSSLLNRFAHGSMCAPLCNIGYDFLTKTVTLSNGRKVSLALWDTGGQERFRPITKTYLRHSDVILLIYDVSSRDSFDEIPVWMNLIENSALEPPPHVVLVGNKSDLEEAVPVGEAQKFAENHKIPLHLTSALTGAELENTFTQAADATIRKYPADSPPITLVEHPSWYSFFYSRC